MRSFIVLHQDLLISLLGYVAAALGGALAVSGMQIKQAVTIANKNQTPAATAPSKVTKASLASPRLAKPAMPTFSRSAKAPAEPVIENADRRNRSETLSLAREMLAKGTSHERIKRLLPVSDGELILLQKSPRTSTRETRGLS